MYECYVCPRQFGSSRACAQHMDALDHWQPVQHNCEACELCFQTPQQARVHMDAYNHWRIFWCEVCEKGFQNDNNLQQHNRGAVHIANSFPHACEGCNLRFAALIGARQHMNANNHWRRFWCEVCKRGFQNDNNLQQHLRSAAHLKDSIACPYCKKGFTVASGVAHHLETGSCPRATNLNRETIYKVINAGDTRGVITNKQLTWQDSSNADFTASTASWNGHACECYLCHRNFKSLQSLNSHLSSPVHKQKLYRCFGTACGKQFTALAQLFNHLESESCGATRFGTVQRNASAVFTGQRLLGF